MSCTLSALQLQRLVARVSWYAAGLILTAYCAFDILLPILTLLVL